MFAVVNKQYLTDFLVETKIFKMKLENLVLQASSWFTVTKLSYGKLRTCSSVDTDDPSYFFRSD